MRYPSFYIVGAARAGTTSLAQYVAQHPDVGFAPNKEPNFFVFEGKDLRAMPGPANGQTLFQLLYQGCVTDRNKYCQLFSECDKRTAIGEASVRYLYYPDAAQRLSQSVPDAKIIILLRNPVDRLWSHYAMMRAKYHLETEDLMTALSLEPARTAAGWDYDWHYASVGRYARQVARFISLFGDQNVRVYIHDDFRSNPAAMLRDIFSFIGVDERFQPNLATIENQGYWLRWFWLDKLLTFPEGMYNKIRLLRSAPHFEGIVRRIHQLNRIRIPPLDANLRSALRPTFADDIGHLFDVLGRRLSW
jgi:hypothetical protein